jgi:hypothetical protein
VITQHGFDALVASYGPDLVAIQEHHRAHGAQPLEERKRIGQELDRVGIEIRNRRRRRLPIAVHVTPKLAPSIVAHPGWADNDRREEGARASLTR